LTKDKLPEIMRAEVTRDQKLAEIGNMLNIRAERIYASAYLKSPCKSLEEFNNTLKPRTSKGLEPKPWCGCHGRNPCPKIIEHERMMLNL